MQYKIVIKNSALKSLRKLEKNAILIINEAIQLLKIQPRPNGFKKLKGFKSLYRIRVGLYRVLYEISDNQLIVTVIKIAHRKDVYENQ